MLWKAGHAVGDAIINDKLVTRMRSSGVGKLKWMFPVLVTFSVLTNVLLLVNEFNRSNTVPFIQDNDDKTDLVLQSPMSKQTQQWQQNPKPVRKILEKKEMKPAHEKKQEKQTGDKASDKVQVVSKASLNQPASNSSVKSTAHGPSKKKRKKKGTGVTSRLSPQALNPDATFCSCLLIRDDNDILSEWIAYHYHVLRMRYLIVAVDPFSETSPAEILDRWRGKMTIELWTDDMYMPENFLKTGRPPEEFIYNISKYRNSTYEEMMEINAHRYRQRYFLARCLEKLKRKDQMWAIHIDTDEYVVASKLLRQMGGKYLGSVPPIEEPGSVLELLHKVLRYNSTLVGYPCISIMRVLFGSVESALETISTGVHKDFNATTLETMRWRYHALPHDKKLHGHSKVILDLTKIPMKFLRHQVVYSIHRPYAAFCRGQGDMQYTSFRKFPIAANHYLGSWERYSARSDNRRSRQLYDEKSHEARGQDDGVRGWLQGFIKDIGLEAAKELLGESYLAKNEAS